MNTENKGHDQVPPDDTSAANQADSDARQFVTFVVGDDVFAVDMMPVQEIIRVPDVVAVPLAPRSLDGLANLRGKVLPIISLRRIFGFVERPHDDATRAVVLDLGQPMGFVVDRVTSVLVVERSRIETAAAVSATVNTDLLSGILKDVGGHPMIMVLDFRKLIDSEFPAAESLQSSVAQATAVLEEHGESDARSSGAELQFVSFEVAGQEYAIRIEDVQEIVQIPDLIIHVPHSKSHMIGVMTLRSRLLPLVSLRRMLGLEDRNADDQSRIVVVSLGNSSVGVVMDRVNAVLRVPQATVGRMPGMLSKDGDVSDVQQICRLDDGKRMVSILSVETMFRHSTLQGALDMVDAGKDQDGAEMDTKLASTVDDEEQVVVFRLGKEEFGVPIDSVQEIVRLPDEMTRVPKAPPAVEGVINLRGAVLPVIDLRRRLGLEPVERSDRQRIVVLLLQGVRTGFIVDSVAEVLKVPKSTIEAAPRLSGEQSALLSRMANMERQKRMVQLIEPAHLIEQQQLASIAELAAA